MHNFMMNALKQTCVVNTSIKSYNQKTSMSGTKVHHHTWDTSSCMEEVVHGARFWPPAPGDTNPSDVTVH